MAVLLSDLIHVGLAKESTTGTASSVQNGHWASWNAFAVENDGDPRLANEATLGQRYKVKAVKKGIENYKITIDGNLGWRLASVLLYAYNTNLSTADDTPEAGVYTHTMSVGNDTNTYSITVLDSVVGNRVYPYAVLSSLKIGGSNELITFSADFVARKYESATDTAAYSSADDLFSSPEVNIQINGVDYKIKDFSLELNENPVVANALGYESFAVAVKGAREEKLTMTIIAEDDSLRTLFENNSSLPVQLTLTDNANTIGASTHPQIRFAMADARIMSLKPTYNVGDLVAYEIEIVPVQDPVSITVINDWDNTEMNK